MIRVYCAGAYSADNIMQVLHNIRVGIWGSTEPLMAGMAVHSPWLDFQWCLAREISIEVLRANSMAWLQVSDAVLLIPGWHNSKGTRAELAEASKLGLPVFESLDALKVWAETRGGECA